MSRTLATGELQTLDYFLSHHAMHIQQRKQSFLIPNMRSFPDLPSSNIQLAKSVNQLADQAVLLGGYLQRYSSRRSQLRFTSKIKACSFSFNSKVITHGRGRTSYSFGHWSCFHSHGWHITFKLKHTN